MIFGQKMRFDIMKNGICAIVYAKSLPGGTWKAFKLDQNAMSEVS